MKTDESLTKRIPLQLKQDPLLRDAEFELEFSKGQLVLRGSVDQFSKKALLVNRVRKLAGSHEIVDLLEVRLIHPDRFDDQEIAKQIAQQLEKNLGSSHQYLAVTVSQGRVVLDGPVKWKYQKNLAGECISSVAGIISIENKVIVGSQPVALIAEKDILAAIYREETITSEIGVTLKGQQVTLIGTVPTAVQKKLVETIVSGLPGIQSVENHLLIIP